MSGLFRRADAGEPMRQLRFSARQLAYSGASKAGGENTSS
jgi:hypothetical protein